MVEFMFEYDEAKSRANKIKHGIDFEEAQALWRDEDFVSREGRFEEESRYIVIGLVDGKALTAVATNRGGRIRIISVRRAREKEVRLYAG